MSNIDNSVCHCNESKKIRLKNFNFNLFCCDCKYDLDCCNINTTLSEITNTKICQICNEDITGYDIKRCSLYLEIYDLITCSKDFDNNNSFITTYNNLYIRIFDFSFGYCFNVPELGFITINKLNMNEVIEKFIHKNIYIWFQENFKYFKNIYD